MLNLKLSSILYLVLIMVLCQTGCGGGSGQSSSQTSTDPVGNTYSKTAPVLFFSDLVWGPKTGWEGSTTKGAAVTIWGKDFGNAAASSKVTVNGTDIMSTNSSYIAEWNATGPARNLSRITFWIPSSATTGNGTISVTVNGASSNSLPFNVTTGVIYFVAVSDGSNSYNGLYATRTGHTGNDGPFKDLWKFNPCGSNDSAHTPGSCNPSQDGQYIVYVRGGTYTAQDTTGDSTLIALRGPYGGSSKQKALIGYPAETVTVDTASAGRGIIWIAAYDPYGFVDYLTLSKIVGVNGYAPFTTFGSYTRVIGCTFHEYLEYIQSGIIQVMDSKHTALYGNYLNHNGYNGSTSDQGSMKHGFYIKTESSISSGDRSTTYTDVGWNEFSNFVANDYHGGVIFVSKSGDADISGFPTAFTYIHDNYFHNNAQECLYVGDGVPIGDVYFYNNICANNNSINGGMTFYNGTTNVYVFNNTFYQVAGAGYEILGTGSGTNVLFENNIWFGTTGSQFLYWEGSTGAVFSSDHDLYYSPSSAPTPTGYGVNISYNLNGDPLFISNGSDFHLTSSSPAISAGTSNVSSVVKNDYDGIVRPQGSAYDIGVYEY